MTIVQSGQINTTAQLVPQLIIQIVPPSWTLLNGVPTNIVGIVGTATWGPVNTPAIGSGVADTTRQFGPMQVRKFDLGTAVAAAALQGGAASLRLVRVTDGTDTAAAFVLTQGFPSAAAKVGSGSGYAINDTIQLGNGTVITVNTVSSGAISTFTLTTAGSYTAVPTNPVAQVTSSGSGTGATFNLTFPTGITFTGFYTGSQGNNIQVTVGTGSNNTSGAPTYKVTVSMPGQLGEVFDNIGGTANAVFTNMVAAINNGQSGLRGPSQLIIATAGASTGTPIVNTVSLTGGTDGATTITSATLIGADTTPRTGMYALRGTQSSIAMLADADDSTQWTLQAAYGLSEGTYMIAVSPAGDTISGFTTKVTNAGVDSYAIKFLLGDWCYINDNVNNQQRLISPQGFIAGLLGNLTPSGSSLNKQLFGIIGTQKTYNTNQQYSQSELQSIALTRGDVITLPAPGGNYFAARFGRNGSSNAVIHGDNYTRMTNYIAATLNAGMGIYIGQKITPTVMASAKATIDGFLFNLEQQGDLQSHQVILDSSNNPFSRTALGYLQADVKARYFAITEILLVNLEGGQSVRITRQSVTQAA